MRYRKAVRSVLAVVSVPAARRSFR
uniref:Uncharacterized protein n=1 Tax=Anguilla anguilla TaxID=7936 RepID=A0A0E9XVE3_ANGAN